MTYRFLINAIGILFEKQRLIIPEKLIEDGKILSGYKIQNEPTPHLRLRDDMQIFIRKFSTTWTFIVIPSDTI